MITEIEHHLIGMIYDASLDAKWEKVLAALVEYMACSAGAFIAFDQLDPHANFTHIYNFPQTFINSYQDAEIRILDMQLHQEKYRNAGVGHVLTLDGTAYAQVPDTNEYIFYERCIKTSGMTYVAGILLEDGQYRWTLFAVYRRPDQPFFTEAECLKLECFSTHIRRALQMYQQFNLVQRQHNDFTKILDCLKVGVILLDKHYNPIYSNVLANKILKNSNLLWLDQFNKLKTKSCFQAQLNTYISSVFYDVNPQQVQHQDVGGVMMLYEEIEQSELKLSIAPFSSFDLVHSVQHQNHSDKAIIFITPAYQSYQLSFSYLTDVYLLNRREITICELFINGYNLKEIAKKLSITISSLRTYFKYIYEKTGCSSQTELMHWLMGIAFSFEHIT
ncbi:MAG: helix-turn-helix transcriptional regulator [Proteobacteria bacterium]|uniref:helix-turn-helix transcriptional regulator n=1 Tax=Acinetobacter venetianus TaxID=52133 RepID=UPI003A8FAB50|nr:helix-turn-helix transcriptional regulator [Pseudomonadota bacterium]MDA1254794.1 helix-turn-helix transcriptional regulator [Pseudomonadota bacterium]